MWWKDLGFKEYPLDPRSNPNLVGVSDIEGRITEFIIQGNMCLLSGFTGSGKTSMLQRISASPKLKNFSFIFISADGVDKQFEINQAIKGSRSFIDMITFRKPKRIVVMLDESHLANRILTESIKSKWNFVYPNGEKMIQSVVISQIESQLGTNFSGSFIDRLGHRVLQMKRLSVEELITVLRNRMYDGRRNYCDKFSEEGIQFLAKSADGSVRQLLEYADAVFKNLYEMKDNPLDQKDFVIDKNIVFNLLQQSDIVIDEKGLQIKKGHFDKILANKRYKSAIEMFEQFGTLNTILLAEKLDVTKATAAGIIADLQKEDAIVYSHTDGEEKYFVLTPRLKHQLVKQ